MELRLSPILRSITPVVPFVFPSDYTTAFVWKVQDRYLSCDLNDYNKIMMLNAHLDLAIGKIC